MNLAKNSKTDKEISEVVSSKKKLKTKQMKCFKISFFNFTHLQLSIQILQKHSNLNFTIFNLFTNYVLFRMKDFVTDFKIGTISVAPRVFRTFTVKYQTKLWCSAIFDPEETKSIYKPKMFSMFTLWFFDFYCLKCFFFLFLKVIHKKEKK